MMKNDSVEYGVRAGDIDVLVNERGSPELGTLLLIAGLGQSSWIWSDLQDALPSHFKTLAFDNRGTGRTTKSPGPYTIEQLATDARNVLDAAGVDGAVDVVGNSMGGYIAQTMAMMYPERVRSLVLCNTSLGGPKTVPVPAETAQAWKEAAPLGPRAFAERTMHFGFAPGWREQNEQRFAQLLERRLRFPTPLECWQAQYDACVQFAQRGIDVEKVRQRTLVVHGNKDRVVPYENGVMLAESLPRGLLHTFYDDGHLPQLSQPVELAKLITRFLT